MHTSHPDNLKDDSTLAQSEVVANAAMNRERNIVGNNSYAKDLTFDPLQFLRERLQSQPHASWLDLCCGTGKALIQAAVGFERMGQSSRVQIQGIDLVDMFHPRPSPLPFLTLQEASVSDWNPKTSYDLITCVHGLHYVGDKLGLLEKVASWLTPNGTFIAHLDYSNLRLADGKSVSILGKDLKQAGFLYKPHKRILLCHGRRTFTLPYRYLGADDQAGPNYTGQPAVNSYYERTT